MTRTGTGTLNLLTGKEIILRSEIMNADVSAKYLQMLLDAILAVPILLFWDRAPWHRSKPIQKLLAIILNRALLN